MKQEDKELLRKDLYLRQFYGVKVSLGLDRMSEYIEPEAETCLTLYYINPQRLECNFKECWWTAYIGAIRPYLRPISSITEEERNEISKKLNYEFYIDDEGALCAEDDRHRVRVDLIEIYTDWLNAHHFDYRGLIEKGLALEAPKEMYSIK
jgi:hypothetical protein